MNDIEIAPSILSADFGVLVDEIRQVEPLCRFLHIDVMDGHYVPNISIGIPVIRTLRKHTDMIFDCHLMISEPEKFIKRFADAGCDYITFHVECTDDPERLCREIRDLGKKPGIAIHPNMPMEKIMPFVRCADLILIMSVIPGFGGQKFMEGTLERIAAVRAELDRLGSDAIISVDGGINNDTARMACDAGARLLVAGNAVFGQEDHAGAVRDLLSCASQS
ncbi:ribulose-phosphate 3-epimerase [Ruminococcaceae bacterium YRB3002]|nr:ribulose-phosphate 3-epimerase [Ruminococcaceae bacterium YRB3002]